jgi:hypothetical protein
MHVSAWAGHDFRTEQFGNDTRTDLTYAYVRYAPYPDKTLLFNMGRHYVFEGVAAELIDGISARWEMTHASGLSLFGGVPVATDFDSRTGDSAVGGRVYQRFTSKAEIGLSFLSEKNDKTRFREEAGVDVWFLPLRSMEIKGHSFYNTVTDGWGEHAYTLRIFPRKSLMVSGLFSQTSYDDAFSARTLNVFSPDYLGKNETLTKKGGLIEYRAGEFLTGVVDYNNYTYKTMGDAAYYGARVSASSSRTSAGVSFHRMQGPVERLRYRETRVYASEDMDAVRLSVDAVEHHYDIPFSSVSTAYFLTGAVRYTINDAWAANASAEYGKSPDFIRNTMVLLNLVYNFKSGR